MLNPDFVSFHNMHIQLHQKRYSTVLPLILTNINTYSTTVKNDTLLYLSHYAKGSLFRNQGLIEESLNSMLQAKDIGGNIDQTPGWLNLYSDIANLFFELEKYDDALQCYLYLQGEECGTTDVVLQGAIYNNIARCYANMESHDFTKATSYYEQSLSLYKSINDSLNIATVYLNLGDLYFEQYQDNLAVVQFKKALDYAQISEGINIRDDIYFNLSLVMESTGEIDKALLYYKEYVVQLEKMWNRDKIWKLAEQEKKFIVDKKQTEIKLLETDAKLQKTLLAAKKVQSNTFFTVASVLLLLLLIGIYAYRQRILKNKIITRQNLQLDELNKTKDRLFSIVAHDLRSPVYLLRESSIQLKKALSNNNYLSLKQLLENNIRMTESTYLMLDNLLYWSLEQKNSLLLKREVLPLDIIINQVCVNYTEALLIKNIRFLNEVPSQLQIYVDLNAFKIIVRNIMDNAIKFTPEGGVIKLSTRIFENKIELIIEDNGIGIDEKVLDKLFNFEEDIRQKDTHGKMGTGLGMELCKVMTEKNGAEIYVSSKVGKGTRVGIIFECKKHLVE